MQGNKDYLAEMNNSSFAIVKAENLSELLNEVKSLKEEIYAIKSKPVKGIYNNKEIKELLGIQDKLLKKYRDDGLLSYHQIGDKFWYTQSDIDQFLQSSFFPAYKIA